MWILNWVLLVKSSVLLDLTISNPDWGELIFGSQNNMPNETNGVNNAVGCYNEAVQFSACFVVSLFASFNDICGTAVDYIFFVRVTLIKIANTPLDKSAALVLSAIN